MGELLYADNMTIIFPGKSRTKVIKTANKELELVCSWLIKHKLIAKPTKTKYMIFSTEPHKVQSTPINRTSLIAKIQPILLIGHPRHPT